MYLLGLAILVSCIAGAEPTKPFWKAKAKVYERVQNHEIILTVRSEAVEGKQKLVVAGGGQVKASKNFVFQALQNYERLSRLSDFVSEPKYDPQTQILKFLVSAFGYRAQMGTRFQAVPHDTHPQIKFLVVEGPVTGFHGTFTLEKVTDEKTEIAMDAEYLYTRFPLPQLFLKFGLEVIYLRLAARLRAQLEDDFKKAAPK